MQKSILLLISSTLLSTNVFAASDPVNLNCDPLLDQEYSTFEFIDNLNGTVTDLRTSLIWAKCTLGQTYILSTNSCSSSGAENYLDWGNALSAAASYQVNKISGWRLPNIKELGSLVDRSCAAPTINLTLFPNTVSSIYYSSTPFKASSIDANYSHLVSRVIDFSDGTELPLTTPESSNTSYVIRAVKGGYR
ncbi:Lcl C-terminal domain-containing protein [Moritella yayanosii]|uniref:Lcl C-terminal domain-containing protein n=1 Tax=Moritella yayanosii TaxID=69539 RepID=A0A330LSJ8_9GAMM|nr:DUF1566 domain-containing protein [Moritella yayanosii]SQD79810.1 conserved exported protein of unknown function [Moritella yayanosii]